MGEEGTNFGIDFDIQNGEYTCMYVYVHMCIQYAHTRMCALSKGRQENGKADSRLNHFATSSASWRDFVWVPFSILRIC